MGLPLHIVLFGGDILGEGGQFGKSLIIRFSRETNYKKSIGKSKKFRFFDMNRDE